MKVVCESARHFERVAEDLRGRDVVVEVKKVEDGDALYRATCKLFGIEPRKKSEEEIRRRDLYWSLVRAMLKEHRLSLKDVSFTLIKDGLKRVVLGDDPVDVVRGLEKVIMKQA